MHILIYYLTKDYTKLEFSMYKQVSNTKPMQYVGNNKSILTVTNHFLDFRDSISSLIWKEKLIKNENNKKKL